MWLAYWLLSTKAEKGARPQSILTARTRNLVVWGGGFEVKEGLLR